MKSSSESTRKLISSTLNKKFRHTSFRSSQEEVILHVLDKKDNLVIMPTGGGKSLCYQLPAVIFEGLTLVISPLISLMKDQVDALNAKQIGVGMINSSMTSEKKREIYGQLKKNKLKLLYISPERISHQGFNELLSQLKVSLIAIDEAHCISQWGHDFRPDYHKLAILREILPDVPLIALTATANSRIEKDIISRLRLQTPFVTKATFYRPNLNLKVIEKHNSKKKLKDLFAVDKKSSSIVYCFSRKETEEIAEFLKNSGVKALPYHAGLSAFEREMNQEAFIQNEVSTITATIAFGMGIDKSDVRRIIHFSMPKNIEGYYQEIGRGGRDGKACECIFFYTFADMRKHEYFLKGATQEFADAEKEKLSAVDFYAGLQTCRWKFLQSWFDPENPIEACGHCDNCLMRRQDFDGTEIAQKILSAVYRTGETFGISHLVDVLKGRKTEKVQKHFHHTLSVFGICGNIGDSELESYIYQLEEFFLIEKNQSGFNTFRLSQFGKKWLKNKDTTQLLRTQTDD